MTDMWPRANRIGRQVACWIVAALAASACDRTTTPSVGIASAPLVTVFTTLGAGPLVVTPTLVQGCAVVTTDLTLVVASTARNVFLDHVTIHLIDGTNVGGPMVTFPKAGLESQFGATIVPGGGSRSFLFTPSFNCGPVGARSIQTDVVVSDGLGAQQSATVVVSIP